MIKECYVVIRDEDNAILAVVVEPTMDEAVRRWAEDQNLNFEDAVNHYTYLNRALIK